LWTPRPSEHRHPLRVSYRWRRPSEGGATWKCPTLSSRYPAHSQCACRSNRHRFMATSTRQLTRRPIHRLCWVSGAPLRSRANSYRCSTSNQVKMLSSQLSSSHPPTHAIKYHRTVLFYCHLITSLAQTMRSTVCSEHTERSPWFGVLWVQHIMSYRTLTGDGRQTLSGAPCMATSQPRWLSVLMQQTCVTGLGNGTVRQTTTAASVQGVRD